MSDCVDRHACGVCTASLLGNFDHMPLQTNEDIAAELNAMIVRRFEVSIDSHGMRLDVEGSTSKGESCFYSFIGIHELRLPECGGLEICLFTEAWVDDARANRQWQANKYVACDCTDFLCLCDEIRAGAR